MVKEHPRIPGIPVPDKVHPAALEGRGTLCHRRPNHADSAFEAGTRQFLHFLKPQDGIGRAESGAIAIPASVLESWSKAAVCCAASAD
jgi:hypothetical protein